ncbi:MAG: hypothetical protein EKK31_04130 [Hyphomicrobiales bacterium]|nr:MAG: hypothetical protein EKK31_04130 [Hyphomicrobiales bacterium]
MPVAEPLNVLPLMSAPPLRLAIRKPVENAGVPVSVMVLLTHWMSAPVVVNQWRVPPPEIV